MSRRLLSLAKLGQGMGKNGIVVVVGAVNAFAMLYDLVVVPFRLNWMVSPDEVVVLSLLRGLCLCYLLANWSLTIQANGLAGPSGLFPLQNTLQSLSLWIDDYPRLASHNPVSLFLTKLVVLQLNNGTMLTHSRTALTVALVGIVYPHPVIMAYLYVNYYATRRVLPEMFSMQWDSLLCESGLLGFVLAAARYLNSGYLQLVAILLFKLLVHRLMLGSGVVKLTSGDMTWRQCSALWHHFLTQPLPGRIAPLLHAMDKE